MRIDRGLRATCLRIRVDPPKGLVSTFLLRQDRLGRGKGWIAGGTGECESRIASLELRVSSLCARIEIDFGWFAILVPGVLRV